MEAEESAAGKTKEEMEAEITKAMLSRLEDFKQEADNLTLEGVRRAIEKDLGLEKFSLDTHKKFIKQCLQKHFYGSDDKKASKAEGNTAEESIQPVKKESASGQTEDPQSADNPGNNSSDLNQNLESSPALDGDKHADLEAEKSRNGSEQGSEINEDIIRNAMRNRAAYFRSNLEMTLAKVRRLLEEDLELENKSLDPYKNFISGEMDAILESAETAKKGAKKEYKKTPNGRDSGKKSKGTKRARMDSDSSDAENVSSGDDEDDEEIRKPQKRPAQKVKGDPKGSKRQKISSGKSKASNAAKKKPAESDSEKSDEGDGAKSSEDGDGSSESSGEQELKVSKKSEKPAPVYGKRVEHLKSIIKSCGMGVPPTVYKRVKQAPESKREASLIRELEEILEKEGLSSNPSEKEIKAVKKRKERAKELEGIDMSNIVSSSRRRSTSSYMPPPKPKIESESDESEEGEEDEDEDSDEGNNNDGEDSSGGGGSDEDDAADESD